MDWTFDLGWFLLGLGILIGGALIIIYHQAIANNFLHGVSSYDRVRLFGVITALIGLLIMANLHTLLLTWFVKLVFKV